MWSFHGSEVVWTYIFGFVIPNLVSVAIFVENRAFLNFGGVGCAIFVENRAFLNFGGVGCAF